MEISSIFCIPDITDWWRQQENRYSMYADLSNVACHRSSIVPPGVGLEACFSHGRDDLGWRKSKPTGETINKKVGVRQFAQATKGILTGDNPVSDTMNTKNDSEMKQEAEERILH